MSATLSATSRRQSAAVGQKRPYTSLGGRFECSGRGHGRIQPFLHWSETATTHATSSLWCDVVRGRSTEREAASHGAGSTHRVERIESTNQIGSHGRVHLPNRIFTAHTNLPVFYYFTVLMYVPVCSWLRQPGARAQAILVPPCAWGRPWGRYFNRTIQ